MNFINFKIYYVTIHNFFFYNIIQNEKSSLREWSRGDATAAEPTCHWSFGLQTLTLSAHTTWCSARSRSRGLIITLNPSNFKYINTTNPRLSLSAPSPIRGRTKPSQLFSSCPFVSWSLIAMWSWAGQGPGRSAAGKFSAISPSRRFVASIASPEWSVQRPDLRRGEGSWDFPQECRLCLEEARADSWFSRLGLGFLSREIFQFWNNRIFFPLQFLICSLHV